MDNTDNTTNPGLVIAALRGGAGKTIATLGIIRTLVLKGKNVIPFKKGPDYIDARWMSMAAGHDCYNLDPYLIPVDVLKQSFYNKAVSGDISIVEGNRGLHDGVDIKGSFSTAELAKWLGLPVLLVVDCTKVTRTAAALVLGCRELDRQVRIGGVILNHIARPRHESIVSRSIEEYTDIPVVGAIPRMRHDPLPMRHLGLTPADEHREVTELLDSLAETVGRAVDMNRILALASEKLTPGKPASGMDGKEISVSMPRGSSAAGTITSRPTVAVIKDQAFQFYYPENIEAIERAGARILFLDAISDIGIPDDVDAIYIGGGFPETQAEKLAANKGFRHSMKQKALAGMPIYAECGGLMYLGENIVWRGRSWPMTGIIPWDFNVRQKPAGHGYSILEVIEETPFYSAGTILKGHEFHYSVPCQAEQNERNAAGASGQRLSCRVKRGHGFRDGMEGITLKNVFGTYTHVHALGHPGWGENIVRAACRYRASEN